MGEPKVAGDLLVAVIQIVPLGLQQLKRTVEVAANESVLASHFSFPIRISFRRYYAKNRP